MLNLTTTLSPCHDSPCAGAEPQLGPPFPAPLALAQPTSPHPAALSSAAGLYLAPHNVSPTPLALEQPGEELPFADERLGRQAAAWRRRQQVLAAQAATLQAAVGPPSQSQQLALILLQVGGAAGGWGQGSSKLSTQKYEANCVH